VSSWRERHCLHLCTLSPGKSKSRSLQVTVLPAWKSADSSVSEWLHGVRLAAPDEQTRLALDEEVITDAERLRVVYLLITSPEREGGAGITPGLDGWSYVDSIFPLHDSKFNRVDSLRDDVLKLGMDPELVS
jgi:hypothetical protein